jgi:two-component system chemotaxis response regulator CheB
MLERRPPPAEIPDDIRAEALIAAQEIGYIEHTIRAGPLSPITCPAARCRRSSRDGLVRYRCHTGHAYTLESLGEIQAQAGERALYGAYRAQQERSIVVRRKAEQARREGRSGAEQRATRRVRSCSGG